MQRVGKGSGWNWGLLGHVSGILVGSLHWMGVCTFNCCCPPPAQIHAKSAHEENGEA